MIKTFALVTLSLMLSFNANAFFKINKRTDFEFYSNGTFIETKGNLFGSKVIIPAKDDVYQYSSYTPVNAFRNIVTAFTLNEKEWLKDNTLGNQKLFDRFYSHYQPLISINPPHVYGYAIYHDYIILLVEQKSLGNARFIMAIKKDENKKYKASLDFEVKYKTAYNVILDAFAGKGELKAIKNQKIRK
jgi:hypothetical protein